MTASGLLSERVRRLRQRLDEREPSRVRASVPSPAIDDAVADIRVSLGDVLADRVAECLGRLRSGRGPREGDVDLVTVLGRRDDATRRELRAIVLQALSVADETSRLQALLLRLDGVSADHPDAIEYAHRSVRRAIDARTGAFKSRDKHFNHHDAREALLAARRLFDAAGRRFFLDRGTLLGCVRDGGFIASDYDIDVGVFDDEVSLDDVKSIFAGSPFRLVQDFEHKVGVESPEGVQIDFFSTLRRPGYFLSKGFRSVHNWYFTPFELMPHPFLGEEFLVPSNLEEHLEENYGNWRHPAIFYDLSYDEPNVVYDDSVQSLLYLGKRLGRALRRRSRFYAEAAAGGLARQFDLDYRHLFPAPPGGDATGDSSGPAEIRIVARWDRYTTTLRRVVTTSLQLGAVEVVVPDDGDDVAAQVTVAEAVDRISCVRTAPRAHLLAPAPGLRAVLIDDSLAATFDLAASAPAAGRPDLVVFDDDTAAVTLDGNRIVARRHGHHDRHVPTRTRRNP